MPDCKKRILELEAKLEAIKLELEEEKNKLNKTSGIAVNILEDKSEELDIIVENSSLGIVLTKGIKMVKINKRFQDMLGYSKKELEGLTVIELSHPEDLEASMKLIRDLEAGLINDFQIKKRYQTKNGSSIFCKVNVSAVRNVKGEIKYQIALIEDVTVKYEQAKMLEVINKLSVSILGKNDLEDISWELVKVVVNDLGLDASAIYTLDRKTQILTQVVACNKKDPKNRTTSEVLTIPIEKGVIGLVARTGTPTIIENTTLDPNYIPSGPVVRFSELAIPIIVNHKVIGVIDSEHSDKGYFNEEHLKMLTNIANITAAKFKNALALIKEKKLEIEKNNLLVKLKKNNEELGNFAQVVSHDLKSPLRSMSALISWIQEDNEGKFDKETNSNFEKLLQKVDKMDYLISGILKYSSIDKISETIEKVDLDLLLKDLLEEIHLPSNVSIELKSKLPIFYSNKLRMRQLFQNLINNAIKYNDKEKGLISIDFKELETDFLFKIQDNGIGINEKYYTKIFDVFEKIEIKEDNSTGIGLSIVKKIINMFNGDIWLESIEGQGTTFFFKLPKKP